MSVAAPLPDRSPGRAPADPPTSTPGHLVAVGTAGCVAFLNLYATQPLLPLLERLFHAGKAAASLTVSATTAAVALAAPAVGILADHYERKRIIVPAIFVLAVPTLLAATASTLSSLVAWRFLQGLCLPAVFAVAIAYVTEEWAGRGVGAAMAALVTGNVVGGFGGRVISGLVAARFGWPMSFVTLGVLDLLGGVAVWRCLPPSRGFRPRPRGVPGAEGWGAGVWALLGDRRLVATFVVGFNVLFSLVATFTYVTFLLADAPFSLGQAALSGIFVVYLVGAVVTPFAGRWIDRLGSRRMLQAALLCAAAGMLLTLAPSLALVAAGLTVCSSAVFICQSASTSYLQVSAPGRRSAAAGIYLSAYYLGGSVGGVLPSLAWRAAGWPGCVALVIAVQLATVVVAGRFWLDLRPA